MALFADAEWNRLISVDELKGATGEPGPTGAPGATGAAGAPAELYYASSRGVTPTIPLDGSELTVLTVDHVPIEAGDAVKVDFSVDIYVHCNNNYVYSAQAVIRQNGGVHEIMTRQFSDRNATGGEYSFTISGTCALPVTSTGEKTYTMKIVLTSYTGVTNAQYYESDMTVMVFE